MNPARQTIYYVVLWAIGIALLSLLTLSCEESLPTYVAPTNVVTTKVDVIEQLSDRIAPPEHQAVRFKLVAENTYDEVFYDSVDIQGTMTITWPRKPGLQRTIQLNVENFLNRDLIKNGKLLLLPGQQVGIQFIWNLKGDDSTYFVTHMDVEYADQRDCGVYNGYTIVCTNPEEMLIEGDMKIFKNLHSTHVNASSFFVIGRVLVRP